MACSFEPGMLMVRGCVFYDMKLKYLSINVYWFFFPCILDRYMHAFKKLQYLVCSNDQIISMIYKSILPASSLMMNKNVLRKDTI